MSFQIFITQIFIHIFQNQSIDFHLSLILALLAIIRLDLRLKYLHIRDLVKSTRAFIPVLHAKGQVQITHHRNGGQDRV